MGHCRASEGIAGHCMGTAWGIAWSIVGTLQGIAWGIAGASHGIAWGIAGASQGIGGHCRALQGALRGAWHGGRGERCVALLGVLQGHRRALHRALRGASQGTLQRARLLALAGGGHTHQPSPALGFPTGSRAPGWGSGANLPLGRAASGSSDVPWGQRGGGPGAGPTQHPPQPTREHCQGGRLQNRESEARATSSVSPALQTPSRSRLRCPHPRGPPSGLQHPEDIGQSHRETGRIGVLQIQVPLPLPHGFLVFSIPRTSGRATWMRAGQGSCKFGCLFVFSMAFWSSASRGHRGEPHGCGQDGVLKIWVPIHFPHGFLVFSIPRTSGRATWRWAGWGSCKSGCLFLFPMAFSSSASRGHRGEPHGYGQNHRITE